MSVVNIPKARQILLHGTEKVTAARLSRAGEIGVSVGTELGLWILN